VARREYLGQLNPFRDPASYPPCPSERFAHTSPDSGNFLCK